MSRPLALLVGGALVPVAYALQWLGAKVLDWWTKPAPKEG